MRKISDKGLVKKLDDIIREKVRERDNNRCVWCGKYVQGFDSQVSHVIPKGRCTYLKWDMQNVKLLCAFCHNELWHRRAEGRKWFDKKFPERIKYLLEHQYDLVRGKRKFMEQKLDELQGNTEKLSK